VLSINNSVERYGNIMNYEVVSLFDRYDLFKRQDEVCGDVWPEFMRHDPVANTNWMKFINTFKDLQLLLMYEEEILAVINTVPIYFEKNINDLPDNGWDWGVKKAMTDYEEGISPNTLMGVQIVVNRLHQCKGLSTAAIKELRQLAITKNFQKIIIPVRPSNKHQYPLIPMENYIEWKDANGFPYDNWLRVHIKNGGKIIKVCPNSMYIPGTIEDWKKWTSLDFLESGKYVVPGALNPISIDKEGNIGEYIEPNVWILH
jgi:hypothetical protein